MAALLGCVLHFCCHVVAVGDCSLLCLPAVREIAYLFLCGSSKVRVHYCLQDCSVLQVQAWRLWVQTTSETYCLLQLGFSWSQFWRMTSHAHTHTHTLSTHLMLHSTISVVLSYLLISYGCASSLLSTSLHSWGWSSHMQVSACSLHSYCAIEYLLHS